MTALIATDTECYWNQLERNINSDIQKQLEFLLEFDIFISDEFETLLLFSFKDIAPNHNISRVILSQRKDILKRLCEAKLWYRMYFVRTAIDRMVDEESQDVPLLTEEGYIHREFRDYIAGLKKTLTIFF